MRGEHSGGVKALRESARRISLCRRGGWTRPGKMGHLLPKGNAAGPKTVRQEQCRAVHGGRRHADGRGPGRLGALGQIGRDEDGRGREVIGPAGAAPGLEPGPLAGVGAAGAGGAGVGRRRGDARLLAGRDEGGNCACDGRLTRRRRPTPVRGGAGGRRAGAAAGGAPGQRERARVRSDRDGPDRRPQPPGCGQRCLRNTAA